MEDSVGFRFTFLGKADLLGVVSTGFGSLQRPLKSIYFHHLRRVTQQSPSCTEAQTLLLDRDGLTVQADERVCEHYPYSHVAYTDLTRFEVFREGKRLFGAFGRHPRGPDSAPVEVLGLDPSIGGHSAIINFPHPPLVVSVLRRSRGVRLLECHLFAADSELSALAFVQELQYKMDGQRQRETHHLFQYTPQRGAAESPSEEAEAFRQTMRSLSRPGHVPRSQTTPAIASAAVDTPVERPRSPSPSPPPPPRPKPRRSKTVSRSARSGVIPRAKSLNFLDPAVSVAARRVSSSSSGESDGEGGDWRPDGSSQRVPRLVTRFEARQGGTERPVARVRPRIVSGTALGNGQAQTMNPKLHQRAQKVRERHEQEQQRMKNAEIAAAMHRLDLSRSQKDFQDALGYLP